MRPLDLVHAIGDLKSPNVYGSEKKEEIDKVLTFLDWALGSELR